MKGILSLLSSRGKHRKNQSGGAEKSPDPLSVQSGPKVLAEDPVHEFAREEILSFPGLRGTHGDAARSGRDDLFSVPAFHAEVREEDLPFRRGGFTDGMTAGGGESDPDRETSRLLLDRTEELKEILSRLNETADEIRKELTI